MNIDLKSMDDGFYKRLCKARVQPVLDTLVLAKELGIHIEITNLVIPGENDTQEGFEKMTKWIVESLGDDVPLHFSRFHPDYQMIDHPRTPLKTLGTAYQIAKDARLKYV